MRAGRAQPWSSCGSSCRPSHPGAITSSQDGVPGSFLNLARQPFNSRPQTHLLPKLTSYIAVFGELVVVSWQLAAGAADLPAVVLRGALMLAAGAAFIS